MLNFSLHSVRSRLSLLLFAFSLLVLVSAGATFWGLEAQKQDATLINLSGRQRMLVQQMSREVLEIEKGESENHVLLLQEAMRTFDQTLAALQDGGPAPYLPGRTVDVRAVQDEALQVQLRQIEMTWQVLHNALESILVYSLETGEFQAAIQTVDRLSPELVGLSDAAVHMYEAHSSQAVTQLRWIQAVFLACAVALLAAGVLVTRRSVIEPLQELGTVTERIGGGNLNTPVQVIGPEEVQVLAERFEAMRGQLKGSQEELLAWTETLEQRVAQRTQELDALYLVSREISSQLDINHVLSSVTHKTQELLGCEVVFLCLVDDQGHMMHLRATSGPETAIYRTTSPVQTPMVGQVLSSDQALRCSDQVCYGYCKILDARYRASHLAAPLRIGRRVIGALCVGNSQPGSLGDEELSILTKLANVTAVALQNARLYEQAERAATLEERQRIAAEMHDGLAQSLSYLQLTVDLASSQVEEEQSVQARVTLARARQALERAIEEARRAIDSLQEHGPLHDTLQEQLNELAREFSSDELKVEWSSAIHVPLSMPRQEAEQVLRVVREALLNAHRHSQARHIHLQLERQEEELVVGVADNGQGFDPEAQPSSDGRRHFGLDIMRARAARIGGRVEIRSKPGAGTCVTLRWPVKPESAQLQSGRSASESESS